MSDKARVHAVLNRGNQFQMFDVASQEVVMIDSPIYFYDDFIGAGHTAGVPAAGAPAAGYAWVKKIVGAAPPTVALDNNAAGGTVSCALTATGEKQDAALYWNDNLSLDVTKGLVWQARAKLAVLPTLLARASFGLQSAWIDGPTNAAEFIRFAAAGNGAILMECFDGTTSQSVATGVSVLATDWHQYRIDCTVTGDITFCIDGVQRNTNGQFNFAATGAAAILQSYNSMYKASGAGLGTLTLDAVSAWNFRQ